MKMTKTQKAAAKTARTYAARGEACPKATGNTVPCKGEAHTNPFIDHCGCCLGGDWGHAPEVEPVDLDAAKAAKLAVPFFFMSDEQQDRAEAMIREGSARMENRTHKVGRSGLTSYNVLVFA